MGTQWTKEQNDVIQFRDCNILVSAAAGSGKTAVLVERILSMLMDEENPIDIDRLLIVTFTNAAAGEMKERIRLAIDKKLEEELSEKLEEHLQKQISLLGNARISTIHSFCQYVIRNYFHVIDLDPDFRIADEGEKKLLMEDVLEKLLETKYEEADPAFLFMSESLAAGRNDEKLEELILKIYHFSMSFPDPERWMQYCMKTYELENRETFLALPWVQLLVEQCNAYLQEIRLQIEYAMKLIQTPDGPAAYLTAIQDDLDYIATLENHRDYQSLSEAFLSVHKWKNLATRQGTGVSDVKKMQVKNLRDQYKTRLNKIQKEYFFLSVEGIMEQLHQQEPVIRQLLSVTKEFSDKYTEEKRRQNLCDFNDLEHLALQIISNETVAEELADHFTEILIDEYQDSNLVQEMLLRGISREKRGIYNMFMVGDVKQSIYRFRLARPELFMEKFDTYSKEEGTCRRIDLHKNFRSRNQVLASVNDVFEKIMLKNLGNVEYDEAARLNLGAQFEPCSQEENYKSEACILKLEDDAGENEENERELEARLVGKKIFELLKKQQVWDKEEGCYRNAAFGDIVILLRTMTGWSETFVKVLQNMGIPAFAGSKTGYFSAAEVQLIMAYLKIIDNPCQSIPLTAVLYSPIGNVDGKTLAGLKCRQKEVPFYQACMQAEELKPFFEQLRSFRRRAAYTPVHELLRQIYEETGYRNYAASMPGGEQREANLEMLIEKAIAFENGNYHGLFNFIRYIENLHKYEVDFGEADILSGETNMVRIMSIHKSKGLEFPIVFVSSMGKQMNQMDSKDFCVLHADFGIALDAQDPILRIKHDNLYKNVLKKQIKNENLGEELRVLYVAFTRAKEKLILTGSLKKADTMLDKYAERLPGRTMDFSYRSEASTYWDWILPIVLQMNEEDSFVLKEYGIQDLIKEEKKVQTEAGERKAFWKNFSADRIINEDIYNELKEGLEYRYPYADAVRIPSKVSVSELKKMSYDEQEAAMFYSEKEEEELLPEFLKRETVLTGAGKGTVYHKVMECMDFSKDAGTELDRLRREGILTEEECAVVDTEKISIFQNSEIGRRMTAAQSRGELYREQQFVLEEKAGTLKEEWSGEESILIQGIIDAYFVEDGKIVLVDYKTDRVKNKDASSLYEKYKVQLDCYRIALERLTGKKVKEQMLYSFYLNQEVSEDISIT